MAEIRRTGVGRGSYPVNVNDQRMEISTPQLDKHHIKALKDAYVQTLVDGGDTLLMGEVVNMTKDPVHIPQPSKEDVLYDRCLELIRAGGAENLEDAKKQLKSTGF